MSIRSPAFDEHTMPTMRPDSRETTRDGGAGPTGRSKVVLTVNGEQRSVSAGSTLEDLLRRMDVDPAQSGIAVALDEEVVPRSDWSSRGLEEGTRVEVITATQGG